jgi:two-component system invasion response regulator UvrY
MIHVLVADDHPIVRRGVAEIVDDAPDMVTVGQASTGREAVQAVQRKEVDVLVLDIDMPEGDGLDVLAQLRALGVKVRTLILSVYPEEQFAIRALRAGAMGYLGKESVPEELVDAIRTVARGKRYITHALAQVLAQELQREGTDEGHHGLSDREYQVMRLLAKGKTRGEIAECLAISPKTVSTYRERILKKLGLTSTADIVRYAVENELVD